MIYIRADMNREIATGHMMRCLAIAHAIKEQGEPVTFLVADENPVELLKEHGFACVVLGTAWDDLEGELPILLELAEKYGINKLLVDHYRVTPRYLEELRKRVFLAYIDDLNTFHYPVDMLICYANYYKSFQYETHYPDAQEHRTQLLLGPSYVPLRSEFLDAPKKSVREKIKSVLILSGGSDPYKMVRRLLARLENQGFDEIIAICGRYNLDYESLSERYAACPQVKLYRAVPDLDVYMRQADVAISAAGSTLYELCALGTPTISYTFADNQIPNALQFERDGLIAYAGDIRRDAVEERCLQLLADQIRDREFRRRCSEGMQRLVDARGARRIAAALIRAKKA